MPEIILTPMLNGGYGPLDPKTAFGSYFENQDNAQFKYNLEEFKETYGRFLNNGFVAYEVSSDTEVPPIRYEFYQTGQLEFTEVQRNLVIKEDYATGDLENTDFPVDYSLRAAWADSGNYEDLINKPIIPEEVILPTGIMLEEDYATLAIPNVVDKSNYANYTAYSGINGLPEFTYITTEVEVATTENLNISTTIPLPVRIDGVEINSSTPNNIKLLLTAQTDAKENGVYRAFIGPTFANITRLPNFENGSGEVGKYKTASFYVKTGSTNKGKKFILDGYTESFVMGTTEMSFIELGDMLSSKYATGGTYAQISDSSYPVDRATSADNVLWSNIINAPTYATPAIPRSNHLASIVLDSTLPTEYFKNTNPLYFNLLFSDISDTAYFDGRYLSDISNGASILVTNQVNPRNNGVYTKNDSESYLYSVTVSSTNAIKVYAGGVKPGLKYSNTTWFNRHRKEYAYGTVDSYSDIKHYEPFEYRSNEYVDIEVDLLYEDGNSALISDIAVDGIQTSEGTLVAVTNHSTSDSGVYVASLSDTWTKHLEFTTSDEILNCRPYVKSGTNYSGTRWYAVKKGSVIDFARIGSSTSYPPVANYFKRKVSSGLPTNTWLSNVALLNIKEGETVEFFDHSYNNINSRTWAFNTTENDVVLGSDTITPQVTYNTPGTYGVNLIVYGGINISSMNSETNSGTIIVGANSVTITKAELNVDSGNKNNITNAKIALTKSITDIVNDGGYVNLSLKKNGVLQTSTSLTTGSTSYTWTAPNDYTIDLEETYTFKVEISDAPSNSTDSAEVAAKYYGWYYFGTIFTDESGFSSASQVSNNYMESELAAQTHGNKGQRLLLENSFENLTVPMNSYAANDAGLLYIGVPKKLNGDPIIDYFTWKQEGSWMDFTINPWYKGEPETTKEFNDPITGNPMLVHMVKTATMTTKVLSFSKNTL